MGQHSKKKSSRSKGKGSLLKQSLSALSLKTSKRRQPSRSSSSQHDETQETLSNLETQKIPISSTLTAFPRTRKVSTVDGPAKGRSPMAFTRGNPPSISSAANVSEVPRVSIVSSSWNNEEPAQEVRKEFAIERSSRNVVHDDDQLKPTVKFKNDNSSVTAMQINHIIACTMTYVFNNANTFLYVYTLYYGVCTCFSVFVAVVGTVFVDNPCQIGVIITLWLYGYINLFVSIFSFWQWNQRCELVAVINITTMIFNHGLLVYFLLSLFLGKWPSIMSDCYFPLYSAQSVMGFTGIAFLLTMTIFYVALYTIVITAWNKKKELQGMLQRRKNVHRTLPNIQLP